MTKNERDEAIKNYIRMELAKIGKDEDSATNKEFDRAFDLAEAAYPVSDDELKARKAAALKELEESVAANIKVLSLGDSKVDPSDDDDTNDF